MSEKVAKEVREGLRAIGKGQAWLAEEVGVSINAVSKWCKTGQISRDNIPKVAAALKRPVENFFDYAEHIKPVASQGLDIPQPDNVVPLSPGEHRALHSTRLERVNDEEAELLRLYREYRHEESRQLLLSHASLIAKAER